jgi:hypothetical protein
MPGKMTIITPSYRAQNMQKIKENLNFNYIDEWIIVYDGSKIKENPCFFDNVKIKEYIHTGDGIDGNPQRNYGLSKITNDDTYIYFLDDDNIVHPNLYKLLDIVEPDKFYTFNQSNLFNPMYKATNNTMRGNRIEVGKIDTAMMLCHYRLVKGITWGNHTIGADGAYIVECHARNRAKHVFIDRVLAQYNVLR